MKYKVELWKEIKDFPNYQISNLGNVKSKARYDGRKFKKEKILKTSVNKKGYLQVCLINKNISKTFRVHRLVAQAFIPNPENKLQVNHIDGNKQNNCVDNLEWNTQEENMKHAYKIGLINESKVRKRCRKLGKLYGHINGINNRKKIIQLDLKDNYIKEWDSINKASIETGILPTAISQCLHGISKKAGNYKWKFKEVA